MQTLSNFKIGIIQTLSYVRKENRLTVKKQKDKHKIQCDKN